MGATAKGGHNNCRGPETKRILLGGDKHERLSGFRFWSSGFRYFRSQQMMPLSARGDVAPDSARPAAVMSGAAMIFGYGESFSPVQHDFAISTLHTARKRRSPGSL